MQQPVTRQGREGFVATDDVLGKAAPVHCFGMKAPTSFLFCKKFQELFF